MSSVKTHVMSFSENSAETRELMRRVSGFGRPDADRAAFSTDHRAVLIAEERLINDQVHIYKVPVPPSFKDPGGLRVVSFGLAYDPPTRSTRLDYMASRMHVYAYRGASVDDVARAFMTFEPEITQDPASEEGGDGPSSLERHKIDLQPSETVRSRGAHQFGTWERRQAMTDDEIVFVVQNVNRWNADDAPQAYALAVALERSEDARPLYADLLALVEVPLVAEAEQRLEIT
jgi:hypothetical protein